MDLTTITAQQFKQQFPKDFPYELISDDDIARAFVEARMVFNQGLFTSDEFITLGFLYLTAHFLIIDARNSSAGLNSTTENPLASRSVGSVSESYTVPEWITKSPTFQYYATTGYGRKYLNMILPRLRGNVAAIGGATVA